MRIVVVPVGRTIPGFNELIDSIGKIFNAQMTTQMIDFPHTRSFRSSRNQYEADVLLTELRRLTPLAPNELALFIVREDLFSRNLNFVFGLAFGDSCIVSTARLDPRFYGAAGDAKDANALFKERIVKEVIHELGHVFGLPHCDNKKCVMVFSTSIKDVDFKGRDFCKDCRKVLLAGRK